MMPNKKPLKSCNGCTYAKEYGCSHLKRWQCENGYSDAAFINLLLADIRGKGQKLAAIAKLSKSPIPEGML